MRPPPHLQNTLLARLAEKEHPAFFRSMDLVRRRLGTALYESGSDQEYVYFPTAGIVSLLYVTRAGDSAELSVVGCEGLVGISLFMGGESTPNRAVVQSALTALRVPAAALKEEFAKGGRMQLLLLKYTQSLITQISQTAVCNLHHRVEQQLCRWLLLSLDRLETNQLRMTQELIANMLGVRRQGVTEAAGKLEKERLIRYARGLITVTNREGLEARCCECYEVVKRESERLMRSLP